MKSLILAAILNRLIKVSKQHVLVPFYHAVSNDVPGFINGLYTPRKIDDFKNDLETLLEFYEPVSLEELIQIVKDKGIKKKNVFHLTFDDGLANFYEIVAPILTEKGIPATVFLNTNFVDNKELFYRYKASLLYENYLRSDSNRQKTYQKFITKKESSEINVKEYLFGVQYKNRDELDSLAKNINFSFEEFLKSKKPYLSLDQIKELMGKGFSFGAHSLDHPFYYQISEIEQLRQTRESLSWLNKKLGLNYNTFSFPFTGLKVSKSFFETLENRIDISFGTSGIKKDVIKNNLQRLSFEIENKNAKAYLIKEYLKYFLRIPLGKGKMKR